MLFVRALLIVGIALSFPAVVSPTAEADALSVSDQAETAGLFDVRTLRHGHANEGRAVRHTMSFYDRWKSTRLRGDSNVIYVYFTTDNESIYAEGRAVIDYAEGALRSCFQVYEESSDSAASGPCRENAVWRPSRRRITVQFPRARLGSTASSYGWSSVTHFRSTSGACRRTCFDFAPDLSDGRRTWISHDS